MYDRDSQTLRRDEEQLRQSAVAKEKRDYPTFECPLNPQERT